MDKLAARINLMNIICSQRHNHGDIASSPCFGVSVQALQYMASHVEIEGVLSSLRGYCYDFN